MFLSDTKGWVLKRLPAESIRGRIAWGAFWSLIGTGLTQGSIILASVISARLLGTAGFGELSIINSTIGMFGIFAGFGLGMTATKYVAELRTRDPLRAGRIIGLSSIVACSAGGVISIGVVIFAPLIARTLAAGDLTAELRISALVLFFNSLNGAQTGALQGFEAFRLIAWAGFIRSVIAFPIMVAGVVWWGLAGAVWGLAIAAAIGCIVNEKILREQCRRANLPIRFDDLRSEIGVLGRFSLPAFLSSAVVGPATWAANTMLVHQPNGYAEMGVFSAANQWRTALLVVPSLIAQAAVPMIASVQNSEGGRPARRILFGSVMVNGLCAIPIMVVLIPLSSWIMSLYGRTFAPRGVVLRTVLLAAAFCAVQVPVGNLLAAFGRMWIGCFMNAAWAVCFLVSVYVLLGIGWGAQAIATGYLIAYIAHAAWTSWYGTLLLRAPFSETVSVPAGVAAPETPQLKSARG